MKKLSLEKLDGINIHQAFFQKREPTVSWYLVIVI